MVYGYDARFSAWGTGFESLWEYQHNTAPWSMGYDFGFSPREIEFESRWGYYMILRAA